MPDFEAIGDAATGAMVGRAVEPRAGEGDGHTHETTCLNCGCDLVGDYCHCCGQHAHVHRTLGAWWHDFLHSVLHLDGKFWRTIPKLALHPGELTRRYIAGERARFISPLALFLFSAFLMFAVFSFFGGPMDFGLNTTTAEDRAEARRELAREKASAQSELEGLQKEFDAARAAGEETASIEREMASTRRELDVAERVAGVAFRIADEQDARDARQAADAGDKTSDEPEINILSETGWPPLDRAIDKAEKNPSLLLYKIQNNAYKFSWALIPISLPFLWLLFLHRKRYRRDYGAYDHLVFITYSIAFMSLGAIVLALLRPIGVGDAIIGSAMVFIPPVHIYRQLRGAYALPRWSAVWRTAVLMLSAFVALGLFLSLLLALGVVG